MASASRAGSASGSPEVFAISSNLGAMSCRPSLARARKAAALLIGSLLDCQIRWSSATTFGPPAATTALIAASCRLASAKLSRRHGVAVVDIVAGEEGDEVKLADGINLLIEMHAKDTRGLVGVDLAEGVDREHTDVPLSRVEERPQRGDETRADALRHARE